MSMLKLQQVTLQLGRQVLLDQATLSIESGFKAALVGRNGTGKTSLFKLIQGELQEDQGQINLKPQIQLAALNQSLPETQASAFDYVQQADRVFMSLQKKIAQAQQHGKSEDLAELYHQMSLIDGHRIDAQVSGILKGLGFKTHQLTQPVMDFSGGWQMRLQLARLLMSRADLILLDEPTNHLDLESIVWLENWLAQYRGTVLVISHDRAFLDRTTDHTIHLCHQKLTLYRGNYSSFAQQLEHNTLLQHKANEKVIKKKAHLEKYVSRFRAKASKAKQAQSRLKAMEKLKVTTILQPQDIRIQFFPSERCGYPTLAVHGDLGYSQLTVLKQVKLQVGEGDRIGVIGQNGSGKSTLLKSLAGALEPLSGKIEHHPKIKIGYFSQLQLDLLDPQASPITHLQRQNTAANETQARTYLGGFGFSHDRVFEPVQHFSGGEKARLALALLIDQRPNVLILDEPTNHLDLSIRESLIVALQDFEGALLVVSHDRHFLECCANELWQVKHQHVQHYAGSLQDYTQLQAQGADHKSTPATPTQSKPPSTPIKQGQTSAHYHAKKIKQFERKIDKLHQEIVAIDTQLADPTLYQSEHNLKVEKLNAQKQARQDELQSCEASWLDLNET